MDSGTKLRKKARIKTAVIIACSIIAAYLLLLVPETDDKANTGISEQSIRAPFVWDQDAYWDLLEAQFAGAKSQGHDKLSPKIDSILFVLNGLLKEISGQTLPVTDPRFRSIETSIFEISPLVAACPGRFREFKEIISNFRDVIKRRSTAWDMESSETRSTLYRLLYGGRQALEEVILQMPDDIEIPDLTLSDQEPSSTPSALILGVRVHSGDILISRGAVPTSALIARGNDFPGNFSHSALLHVDAGTGRISIIESHIECGVLVSTLENYIKDKKIRIMVLRLRSDHPLMKADPLLPHKTATFALERARREHIPYDFAMDFNDSAKWFCSEVISDAYKHFGINLWMGLSYISNPGLRSWLGAFGVRNFITQEPSDLEYDPQLKVTAEWCSRETLRKDHLDNAATEVLLDGAYVGEALRYSHFLLPFARLMKAYSFLLNQFGYIGPVPEGMTATAALKNKWYTELHSEITLRLADKSDEFRRANTYNPPYWRLVKMAREIKADLQPQM